MKKSIRVLLITLALSALSLPAWSQRDGGGSIGGSGSGPGGTGVDSAVQSYGEASGKTSGGLASGLENAFGGLTIEDGLGVGDRITPDFALLGEPDSSGDAVVFTIADTGIPVRVIVHRERIASIEPSGPIPVIAPGVHACS